MPRVRVKGVGVVSFPDSMSQGDIEIALQKIHPPEDDTFAGLQTEGTELRPGPGPLKRALGLLPTAGGLGGALLGGAAGAAAGPGAPAAIPLGATAGAGIVGAGGEAWRQNIERGIEAVAPQFAHEQGMYPPETSGQAAGQIGAAGAEQALYEAGGRGLAALGSKAAVPLMQGALRSGAEDAMRAIKNRIPATKAGMRRISMLARESTAQLGMMLREADRRGVALEAPDIADDIARRMLPTIAENSNRDEVYRMLKKHAESFVNSFWPDGPITASVLQRIKSRADRIALPMWNRIEKGEAVDGVTHAWVMWNKGLGDSLREYLERMVPPRVDAATGRAVSISEQNAATQELIQVQNRLRKSTHPAGGTIARVAQRSAGSAAGAAAGASVGASMGRTPTERVQRGAEGAVAGAVAGSPTFLSHLSLALTHPSLAFLLTNGGRAGGAVVHQAVDR